MFVEIIVPVLFNALLVLIRSLVEPERFPNPTIYEPFPINTLDPLRLVNLSYFILSQSDVLLLKGNN